MLADVRHWNVTKAKTEEICHPLTSQCSSRDSVETCGTPQSSSYLFFHSKQKAQLKRARFTFDLSLKNRAACGESIGSFCCLLDKPNEAFFCCCCCCQTQSAAAELHLVPLSFSITQLPSCILLIPQKISFDVQRLLASWVWLICKRKCFVASVTLEAFYVPNITCQNATGRRLLGISCGLITTGHFRRK